MKARAEKQKMELLKKVSAWYDKTHEQGRKPCMDAGTSCGQLTLDMIWCGYDDDDEELFAVNIAEQILDEV